MTDIIPVNMSSIDRLVRLVAGLLVLSLYFVGPKTDWALIAVLPIATAVLGYCPLYALFGRDVSGPQLRRSRERR